MTACRTEGRAEERDQSRLRSRDLNDSTREQTHVVLSDERKELSEGSSEVGSKNGSEGSNKVGSVGDKSRLVLGRVGVSLVNISLIGVGILLAERLALEDLGSVESDLLEL